MKSNFHSGRLIFMDNYSNLTVHDLPPQTKVVYHDATQNLGVGIVVSNTLEYHPDRVLVEWEKEGMFANYIPPSLLHLYTSSLDEEYKIVAAKLMVATTALKEAKEYAEKNGFSLREVQYETGFDNLLDLIDECGWTNFSGC